MMKLYSGASRPMFSRDEVGFVYRVIGSGTVAMVVLAAGIVGIYAVILVLGAMGWL